MIPGSSLPAKDENPSLSLTSDTSIPRHPSRVRISNPSYLPNLGWFLSETNHGCSPMSPFICRYIVPVSYTQHRCSSNRRLPNSLPCLHRRPRSSTTTHGQEDACDGKQAHDLLHRRNEGSSSSRRSGPPMNAGPSAYYSSRPKSLRTVQLARGRPSLCPGLCAYYDYLGLGRTLCTTMQPVSPRILQLCTGYVLRGDRGRPNFNLPRWSPTASSPQDLSTVSSLSPRVGLCAIMGGTQPRNISPVILDRCGWVGRWAGRFTLLRSGPVGSWMGTGRSV